MPKIMQRWQFGSQSEQSLSAELDTCQSYGFDGLLAKAIDGTSWMREFDGNQDALGSVDQVAAQAQAANDRGVSFFAWFNPTQHGMTRSMAQLYADIINACDGGAFDTEPYAGFLGAWPPAGMCAQFMDWIKESIDPSKLLIWQPDPRPNHLDEVRGDEWGPRMTHFAGQDYVQDFYFQPTATLMAALLASARDVATKYSLTPWTTLPGNADQSLLPVDQIQMMDGFVVWRMGSTNSGNLAYLGGINMTDTPTDDCAAVEGDRDTWALFCRDIGYRVVRDGIGGELNRRSAKGALLAPRRAVLQSFVDQAVAEMAQRDGVQGANTMQSQAAPVVIDGPHGNVAEGSNQQ